MSDDSLEAKRRLAAALEQERRRIGEQIHDTLCQTLTGLSMLAERLERAAQATPPVPPKLLQDLRNTVDNAISEARGLAQRFNPASLQGAGLMTALQELARARKGEFACEKPVFVANAETALALYRIAEAFATNEPGTISIRLEERQPDVVMTIRISALQHEDQPAPDLIHDRAEVAGGTLRIEPDAAGGIVCTCQVPRS